MNVLSDPELSILSQNILRLRKAFGYSQMTLAYHAKTRSSTISELENGVNRNPGWEILSRIAKALNTSVHLLLMPNISTVATQQAEIIPPGLSELIENEDKYFGPNENRLSLQEVEWLKKVPLDAADSAEVDDYLLILRHFRLFQKYRFSS